MQIIKKLVIAGNVTFILWIWFNGIDEGFSGPPLQVVSYIGLTALLITNIVLLVKKNK